MTTDMRRTVSAEAQITPVQIDGRLDDGVRVAIHYDAGISTVRVRSP